MFPQILKWTTEARKVGVYVVTIAALLLGTGLVPDPYDKWLTAVVVFLGGLGIYKVENTNAAPKVVEPGGP